MRSATISRSNSVAIPKNPVSDGVSKSFQIRNLAVGCVMAILRKDNSQSHDYVVAMRNSESLPHTLWGALQYDSEPHAFVLMSTANEKSNLHTNYQVKVLPMGPVTLGTWCRPAANTFSAVVLCVRDKILSLPNNILPLTLADMPDVVDGKGNRNLDCMTNLHVLHSTLRET
jgi:hypothetical protein